MQYVTEIPIIHRTKIIRNLIDVDLTKIFTDLLIIACTMRTYIRIV